MNLDLGASLLNGLAVVDPADIDVARFVVCALLGSDYDHSPYTQSGERIARLAASGIRLVLEEFRSDVTKTRKDGSWGRLRIDYGDPRQPDEPVAWLWKFIDGAKSAGELYGRALVVIAAEQYASRLVVPASQRSHPTHWSSHKDLAREALAKLAAPHLPASVKALETAVAKAHRAYQQAEQAASRSAAAGPGQVRKQDASDDTAETSESVESVNGQELAAKPDLISKAGSARPPRTPPSPVFRAPCRPRELLAGAQSALQRLGCTPLGADRPRSWPSRQFRPGYRAAKAAS